MTGCRSATVEPATVEPATIHTCGQEVVGHGRLWAVGRQAVGCRWEEDGRLKADDGPP